MGDIVSRLAATAALPAWHADRIRAEASYRDLLAVHTALRHGRLSYLQAFGIEPWLTDVVWHLLGESVAIWRVLPDREREWLRSGQRSQRWEVMQSYQEWFEVERDRLIDGIEAPEAVLSPVDSHFSMVDVAMTVSRWIVYLRDRRNRRRFVGLVREAASREFARETPARIYGRLRRAGYRNPEQALRDLRQRASGQIVAGLRIDFGIRAIGGGFVTDCRSQDFRAVEATRVYSEAV